MGNEEKPHRQGHSLCGSEMAALLDEHDTEVCQAVIAIDMQRVESKTNVVLLVLGSAEGIPVAFAPISCVHGIDAIIDRLRLAARDAFKNQPCTICEKVE